MANEDYLMIASGVINVFLSLFVLWIAPHIGLQPQDALTYIVSATGAGGLLTIGKHVLDKRNDSRNTEDVFKMLKNFGDAIGELRRENIENTKRLQTLEKSYEERISMLEQAVARLLRDT